MMDRNQSPYALVKSKPDLLLELMGQAPAIYLENHMLCATYMCKRCSKPHEATILAFHPELCSVTVYSTCQQHG